MKITYILLESQETLCLRMDMRIEPRQDILFHGKKFPFVKKKSLEELLMSNTWNLGANQSLTRLQPYSPNCWLLLDFDTIQETETLEAQLAGPGGSVENTGLYLDPISARNWLRVATQYAADFIQGGLHYAEAAAMISHYYQEYHRIDSLDIIALGSGEGKREVDLTQYLLKSFKSLRLLLLDVSHPLLRLALKCAVTTLGSEPNIDIFGILGNFHQLQRHMRFFSPSSPKKKRLVTMVGHTWGNLSNEIFFVRNSLAGLEPGDLFLVDFVLTAAPANQPEEIRKKEPRLASTEVNALHRAYEQFFTSTLKRYCDGFQSAQFSFALDDSSISIPGSYALERRARVKATGHPDRDFSMYLYKRYDISQFIARMRQEGFGPIHGWRFGVQGIQMLYLFEKLPPA